MELKICPQSLSHSIFTNNGKFGAIGWQTCHRSSDLLVLGCTPSQQCGCHFIKRFPNFKWLFRELLTHSESSECYPASTQHFLHLHSHTSSHSSFFSPLFFFFPSLSLTQSRWAGHHSTCDNSCMCIYLDKCLKSRFIPWVLSVCL